MRQSRETLETLWDPSAGEYYSRDHTIGGPRARVVGSNPHAPLLPDRSVANGRPMLTKVMEDAYLVDNPLPAAERPAELELVRAQAILARSDLAEHELVRHRWLEAVRIRRSCRSA